MPKDQTGTILCIRCKEKAAGKTCSFCRSKHFYVRISYQGKHQDFRKDTNGQPLTYDMATSALRAINTLIAEKNFNPKTFMQPLLEWETVWEEWMKLRRREAEAGEISESYVELLEGFQRNHFQKAFGGKVVADITDDDLEDLLWSLKGLKVKTKRCIMIPLKAFFVWMKRKRKIDQIPEFPIIKGSDAKPRKAVTRELQELAFSRIPEQHRDVFLFGSKTGLRAGELGALKVKDIDLYDRTMCVQRTWIRGQKIRENTKGKHKDILPLAPAAGEIAARNMEGKNPDDFLFINTKGQPYTPKRIYEIWIWWRGEEFDGITEHELIRHSFCTYLIENLKVAPTDAQRLMRHRDLSTTMKYYHGSIGALRSIVERI